jgi:hypothetical protein
LALPHLHQPVATWRQKAQRSAQPSERGGRDSKRGRRCRRLTMALPCQNGR